MLQGWVCYKLSNGSIKAKCVYTAIRGTKKVYSKMLTTAESRQRIVKYPGFLKKPGKWDHFQTHNSWWACKHPAKIKCFNSVKERWCPGVTAFRILKAIPSDWFDYSAIVCRASATLSAGDNSITKTHTLNLETDIMGGNASQPFWVK